MLYLDTSILVTAHVAEPTTAQIQDWLGVQMAGSLATSHWAIAEYSSALALMLRERRISPAARAMALAEFRRTVDESLVVLAVSVSAFMAAARFIDNHRTGLRAGDALHLAIASEHGAVLWTRDRRLAESGLTLGVETALL